MGCRESLQGGEGQDCRIPAAGTGGARSRSGRRGGGRASICTSDPHPWRASSSPHSVAFPQSTFPLGRRFGSFRERSALSVSDRKASRREPRPLCSGGARPRPSRRARALPSRSRPPAAGTRVAAYKRGGTRASPPLPAAEPTVRSGGRGSASVSQQPPQPRALAASPAGAGEKGSGGARAPRRRGQPTPGPQPGRPRGGEGRAGAGPARGQVSRPCRSLRRAGSRTSRSRPPCGAWAAGEAPGRARAPAVGMSLTGRRGWRGRGSLPAPRPGPAAAPPCPIRLRQVGRGLPGPAGRRSPPRGGASPPPPPPARGEDRPLRPLLPDPTSNAGRRALRR